MSRLFRVIAVLICVTAGAFADTPSPSHVSLDQEQAPGPNNNAEAKADGNTIIHLLKTPIDTKGFQDKLKLKLALELFGDMFQGNLPIIVDKEAFVAQYKDNEFDPYEAEVSLPPLPRRMEMSTALQLILSQVSHENVDATFLICRGYVKIVPTNRATAKHLLTQTVFARVIESPLDSVLRDLSDQTGLTINLDPAVGKKAATPINASFRNVGLEDALVTVTEMAELKFVVLRDSIYVTLPGKVEAIEQEEKKREERRQPAKVKVVPAK